MHHEGSPSTVVARSSPTAGLGWAPPARFVEIHRNTAKLSHCPPVGGGPEGSQYFCCRRREKNRKVFFAPPGEENLAKCAARKKITKCRPCEMHRAEKITSAYLAECTARLREKHKSPHYEMRNFITTIIIIVFVARPRVLRDMFVLSEQICES